MNLTDVVMSIYKKREIARADIAGVVVLYNCDNSVINNIKTYLEQINVLYIIDNSDTPNELIADWATSIPSINYFSNNGNLGIANALNKAANIALCDGYSYMLTMDDDSKAPHNMIDVMISFLNSYTNSDKVGIISVLHGKYNSTKEYRKVNYTMTSGNLINLNSYKKIGGFNNQLFIDHVDHEYNLRLKSKGFDIIEINSLKLEHSLGTVKKIRILGVTISFISHSPRRFFYLVRNSVYILRHNALHSPSGCYSILYLVIKETTKSILYEEQKKLRYKYFLQAIRKGWKGELGKLTN